MADDEYPDESEYGEYESSESESTESNDEEEVTVESDEYWLGEDEMLADIDELVSSGLIGDSDEPVA